MVILERNIRLFVHSQVYEPGHTMVQSENETNVSDLAILAITVMIFAIFVVGLTSVCYRWDFDQLHPLDQPAYPVEDSIVEFRPVRRSRSNTAARGIDEAIVKSFPTFLYSEVKERRIGKGGVECAVCLCEFEDDETLRLMPNCCHVFHADCVSVWLRNHSTCPLCRVDLVFQPGEGSGMVPDPDPERRVVDSTDAHLFEGMTWTNRNRPARSWSMRLSHCRVSEILFSRSNSTGHCAIQPVENVDRFTLRLPEDVRRQLAKKRVDQDQVALTQERSSRRGYRSKSAGSEWSVFSDQRNNDNKRRLQSMSFSFCDCRGSTSDGGCAVAPTKSFPRSTGSDEQSFKRLQPDDRV